MTGPWTLERVARLAQREVAQLRSNAQRLGEPRVVSLCDAILQRERPVDLATRRAQHLKAKGVQLVSRRSAFETRGVALAAQSSWGGIRHSDGTVVLSIWKDHIRSEGGQCSYLLWAPNTKDGRPWSDKPGGRERLEHCREASARGFAEALLVYGERLEGYLPEDRAASIVGIDPAVVLRIEVVLRGREYWAVWGHR